MPGSNPTITIDLEVNGAKATQSINSFKDDAIEKLESISKVQDSLDPVLATMQTDKSLIGSGDAFDSFSDSILSANAAITQMKKTLSGFVSSINIGKLSDGMTQMFESAYRTMISSVKTFNDEINAGLAKGPRSNKAYSSADQNIRLATATGLSASADMLRLLRIANNAQKETGLSTSQIDQVMPALYSIAKNKTDEYRRTTRSTPRLNELASFVADQDLFKKTATDSISGYNPTQQQLTQLAKAAIVATRHSAYRDNLSILQAAGLKGNEYEYVTDQMPEVFKNAYINYGRSGIKQEGRTQSALSGQANASDEVYRNYRRLVQNGNQQAIRLGLDVGLLRASNGYYQFSGNANMAQLNTMAGLAGQIAGDAKSSLPYYYTHRNDQTAEGQRKLLGRQNNIYNDILSLMEVLSGESRLSPDAFGYVDFSTDPRKAIKANQDLFKFVDDNKEFRKFNRKALKIQTLGVADQYVVPKTFLDSDGNLTWRDPSWQKENGVQEKKDDYFATVGNSALTWLLDMYGNNTYGYGRDDDGRAAYRAPKILRVNTSQLYKQVSDKNGTRMIVDPTRKDEADRINRLFARQETASYGKPGEKPTDYIAAFGDAESLTMIQKDDYDTIVKRFSDLGMANPFDNMNVGGLFESGNYKNAAKMIDVGKKKATPGFQYSMLGYNKNPSAALVDFEKIYDYLGIPKSDQLMRSSQRLDGLALFDPTVLGVNAQMRAGLVSKFMGQTTDWRRLLYGSHLLQDAYALRQNRGLIDINKDNAIAGYGTGYSFYMPQIGLGENEEFELSDGTTVTGVNGLIDKMNSLAKYDDKTPQRNLLNEIRKKYFFDIMDKNFTALLPESTVKNNDKFRIISKSAFDKGGLFENEAGQWAKDLGNGTVALTADQQRRYFEKAVEMSGGYWINRTGYDFRTDKDFLPETLAAAMGADSGELKEQSNANYDEYIHKMQTDDNARIRFLKQTSYGRRLVEDGLYNSDLANRLIQSHINDYEAKRQQGHLFLPEYGIDNLLTGVLPGSIFGNIFESAFGVKASDSNIYRKLFSYQDDNDRVFMQTLTGTQTNAMRHNAQVAKLMLSRMPAAPGEYGVGVQNLGDKKAIQRALDMLGVDYSNTVFTDPSLQYKLMTGDYDGDTAWVIRGLNDNQFERMEAIQRYVQNARQKMKEQLVGAPPEEKKKLENDLEAYTNFGADHFTAQLGMGLSTAAIRNSLADLDDNDPDKWIAIAEAIDAYDKNTSEAMKEGKIVKLGAHASREAMEGAVFKRFVKQINAYGAGSDNANPNLFSTRLPEIRDTATLYDIVSNFKAKRRGENVGIKFGNDFDSWLFDQYGYSNSYEAQAARAYGEMFKNVEGGIRLVNRDDIAKARLIAVKWGNSLEKDRRAGRNQNEIAEEQSRLNSFVRRLSQQEESGSLYEDYIANIQNLEKQREDLIKSGISPNDRNIQGLDKKIGIYKILTEDMSQPLQAAQKNWDAELEKMETDIRERYDKNIALAMNNGVNLSGGIEAMIGPALSTDLVKAGKINFSDVSPWLYEKLNNKKMSIGVQAYDFDAKGQMVKSNEPQKNVSFFPYPHNSTGILGSKGEIIAREMDTKHEWIPYTDTADTVMGSLRHNAFQEAMTQYAKGNKKIDAAKIYEGLLSSANASQSSKFKQLGLSFDRNEATGEYTIGGADEHITAGMRAALGTWNSKSNSYEGGSIANLVNYIIGNGYKVANVEGINLDQNGNYMNSKDVDPDDYSGRGTRFSTKIKDSTGKEVEKVGTFAPDLILQDKNGQYSMIDYKSSVQGAWDSIYQMMVYAKDIQEKVQTFQKNGQADEAKRLGWDQYVDDKGNLKFKSLFGYDTSSGKGYRYTFNDKVAEDVFTEYKSAISDKLFNNKEERIAAERRLAAEAAKKYGIKPEVYERKTTEEAVRSLAQGDKRGEWYSDYLANKFVKDEESLNEIMKIGYSSARKYGDREVGGYSQFASARRQLEDAVNTDTIDKLIKEAEDRKDTASVSALLDYQNKVARARSTLNEGEMNAARNAFEDVESFMAQQFFGVKEAAPLTAFNAVRKRMLDAASIREGLKENKEVYNSTTQEWLNDEYKKAYEQSVKDEAVARETFESYIPQLKDRAIKQNNEKLGKLLSDNQESTVEEEVEKYYQDRIDALQQYVKQQENNLNEYSKKLNQKDNHGQLVLKNGSKERELFEELRDNSRENFLRASQALSNTSSIQEAAQREYEKQIGLVGGDRIRSKADKQKEYLDKIKRDYEEIQDENLIPLIMQMNEAELSGDRNKYQKIRNRLDYLYKDSGRRKAKMAEYKGLEEEYETERELENIRQEIKGRQVDSLYTGTGMSDKERMNFAFLQRKAQAQEYAKTLDKESRKEFWKTHQDPDLRKQIEQEFADQASLRDLQHQNKLASSAMQGDIRIHNMQRAFNQANRQQQMRYSRSRIAQALYGVEQRRENAREQVYSIDRQKEDAQRIQDYYAKQLEIEKKSGDQEKIKTAQFGYDQATQQLKNLDKASQEAKSQLDQLTSGGQIAQAVFGELGQAIGMVAQRLGRQLFQKALQETKRFVKEFDSSMNEIQAITMKSNDEMRDVRTGTVNRAIGLRTSVSNVATTEAALYRQGLSDTEVADRTESIIKFATVTKLNVAEATKIITTALQNDLVPSAEAAMDALVALGDSAATTAAEIGKGMQKAAASAKVAGVSYEELTALLTIGTSDTQLSGTQVGTALQTVFSRMRRLSLTGYTADQNGEKTTASDAEAALAAVGVDLWDNKTVGQMRSAYDVMLDLSKVWQNLNDAQKSIVTNAMAGTRQTNIFSTLMEGMSEDNGATLEKYLGLAEGSEGVTQSKYEIAMQSLAASMDTVRSSWDAVVESMVSGGSFTGILDGVSGFLQMFANAGGIAQGMSLVAGGITGIAVAIAALSSANPAIKALSTILGIAAGLAVGGGIAGLGSLFKTETEEERANREYSENYDWAKKRASDRSAEEGRQSSAIEKVRKLGRAYDEAAKSGDKLAESEAADKLTKGLYQLADAFPDVSKEILAAIQNLANWEQAVDSADKKGKEYIKQNGQATFNEYIDTIRTGGQTRYNQELAKLDSVTQAQEARKGLINVARNDGYKPLTNVSMYGGRKLDESLENGAINLEVARNALNTAHGQRSLMDIFHIARKESSQFRDYSDSWLSTYHGSIKDDLLSNKDYGDRLNDYSQYVYDLFENIQTTSNKDQGEYERLARELSYNWAEEAISSMPLDLLAADSGIDQEKIATAINRQVMSVLRSDTNGTYINKDGTLNVDSLANYLDTEVKQKWVNGGSDFVKSLVKDNLTSSDYAYHVNTQDGFVGFDNLDEAREYVRNHGLDASDIKTKDNKNAVQTVDAQINAIRQQNNANNRQNTLDTILNGSGVSNAELLNQQILAGIIAERDRSDKYEVLDKVQRGEVSVSDLTEAELMKYNKNAKYLKPLTEYEDIDSMVKDYERIGLDGVLSSYIASNSNALIAYLNNDKEAFDVALQESVTGRQTPTGVMNAIFDSIVGSPEWAKRVRNDSDLSETYKLFQSIFGENADNILNAAEEGTYNDEANKNLRDYVNRTLSEKGIKVGTGRQFTGEQTASLAQQIISNYSSLAEAQRGMTTWTTDEWTAIQNKYPDLIRYLQMDDAQRASQEGQNLKRNIDIQFSVAGVEDLEEAGKVTSGLTQLLTDLQKNGEVKIKAQMELESGYNDRAQTLAKLINGTSAEKIDAMRSMGYTDQEIEEDFGGTLSKATSRQRALITGQGARNLDELYRIDPEEAERLATKYGYVRNTDSAFIGRLKGQGYRIDEQTGNVYNPNGQIDANATMQYNLNTKYRYRGSGIGVYRSNLLLGQERQATSTELAGYQRAFLDEEARNNLYRSNYSAYEQAYNSLGEEGRRLVAMQQENQAAAAANETARYTQDAIDAQRARAEAENRQYERDAIRQQLTNELSQSDNRYIRENAQQIVSARDIFTNGSFAEQLGLISGYSDTMRALQQAQYGLEGGNTAENRGYISSLLGLSDEQVDEMFQNGQEGELQTAINDKVKEFYQKLATELLPEELLTSLDFDTMSLDDIISSLDQVPEDLRELIEPFLKAINEAKDGVQGDNTYKSLSDVASSSLESTRKRGAAMSEVYDTLWGEGGEASFSERVSALQQNKNVDWGSIDNGLLYMVNSFGQEGSAITEDMINDAYYNALYGRKPSPETQRATMNSLFGGNMSGQNMIDTYRDWMQNQEQYAAEINAFNSLDHSDELANILKSEGVSANTAEKALRKYNEQVNEDKLKDVTQFSKGSANLASALSKIKKGGKDASEGTEMIRKNIEGFQDQMTAISKAQGKSGKQLDTKTLGFIDSLFPEISSDEIKQLSKDRLAELLEGAEDAVNEAATDDFQAIWDSMVDDLSLNYDLSNITVNPDGTLNLDALDDTARAAVEEAIARLEAYAGDLASLTFVQEEGKEKINLKALISKNANGKYHGRGGGGGGGGKSAADKLLEKQKFDVSAIQHDQKMLEIQEKNYDRYNDDAAYRDNINQQIQVQQRLADQYQKNIQEIENMRRSTKEGSDDWNKLTESLWAAQEAFAGVAEAVDALYAKMDAQQKQLYEYNSTLLQHKQTMSEIDYTFYMNVNDPEAALGEIDKQLTGMNDIESEDRRRRAEIVSTMEDEYLRNGESDRYRDLVGERDSLTEKIAKSVNDRIALDATRLDVQKQYQQNEAIPYTHRLNMISSQMERADLNEDTESYNKLFEEQENIYKEIEERNNKHVTQLESLRDYYNSKGQTQNALNTTQEINSLLEQNDNMLTQRDKARKDKLEKEQNDTRESLQRQTMTEEHQNNGYALMANAYKRAGNHGAYRDMLQRQIANWRKMITVQKSLLAIEVEKLKAMEKETEEYYKQLQLVQEIEGKITELEANIANAEMDIMEDRVDEILEGIDRINDLSSHIQKLIKDQGQIYQNQGNWDAYFIMAEKRREELTSSVADMTAQAAQLKAEMGSVPYGSGPWDNLRQKVLSLEESISSARVELENFDRELESIKVDRMLDEINRHEGNRTHNITLMQYEQTRYQTNGELTNYGIMLQKEIDYREENTAAMEEELTLLREELENINLSEKDYYRLSDAIKKKEEALLQNNNAIEKNNKLLRQNEQAIRKTRLELEQMVLKVIEDNKKKQRDMLNNTVEMQNIILNVIKRRYQDEWDLEKETLDRKKDALEKEKQLINERLNYRRQMMNAENKYSELNDYQRQLALISADPTRSKESKELTRKIDELRQDIRWDEASQQAEAATERIEDEINAINEYVQIHGENLQEMLLDANNFAAEVKEVLSGSYADIVLWLQQNDIDYQNSLDERKKQLEEGWKETWMAMKGIVETYWDEIEEILSSQDSFMQFMYENSLDYANTSVTGQLQLASQWKDGWTDAANAVSVALHAIDYTPDIHEDFTPQNAEEAVAEAMGWDYDDSWPNNGSGYNPGFTSFSDHKNDGKEKGEEEDTKPDETQPDQPTTEPTPAPSGYAGTEEGPAKEPAAPETPVPPVDTGTQKKQNNNTYATVYYSTPSGAIQSVTGSGIDYNAAKEAAKKNIPRNADDFDFNKSSLEERVKKRSKTNHGYSFSINGSTYSDDGYSSKDEAQRAFDSKWGSVTNSLVSKYDSTSVENMKRNATKRVYKEGGLVDYTGPAWVDGTKSKPEAFLSAYDTANIKALTDALNYVNVEPFRVPNLDKINTSNQTIGDINITINGAEMKDDADFEDVARRVGQEFTKQLRKEGLNLASYAF